MTFKQCSINGVLYGELFAVDKFIGEKTNRDRYKSRLGHGLFWSQKVHSRAVGCMRSQLILA